MLIINPFINAVLLNNVNYDGHSLLVVYLNYIVSLQFIGQSGPLWFAFALLIFSVIYALIRYFSNMNKDMQQKVLLI